ncbi:hypothetical protein CWB99_16485 [Pseudoalteromonas rubra]|uniref:Spore protein YkvP/CgeB glycosyl transferase-like domain-containing protein n=1 Tax=Pseudoalteromonas rubra TaxID=43658 RepID=A0A5S3WKA9_9GAMM|nr:hypothetical protein [Pseudoalteromonas rubra]TMP27109.1 hypothetical protein CWB99_16485 [Pseudoalteromonas rubra]TMP36126.1 hypothetical protein CWC00_02620 [Pseudoalteromonas rubra]
MSNLNTDIYFETFEEAIVQARKSVWLDKAKSKLQLCFYSTATNLEPDEHFDNLIYLPKSKFTEVLLEKNYRPPQKSIGIDDNVFEGLIREYNLEKTKLIKKYKKCIKEAKLDFSDPLRVYLSVDFRGFVVEKIYYLLSDAFEKKGYRVKLDKNTSVTMMDDLKRLRRIAEFNPHIMFNINRSRSELLNESTFNFIWFMDPTLCLYDDSKFESRARDFYFYLVDNFKKALLKKHVPTEKISKQTFASDRSNFYIQENITRLNKIVFIGNDYFDVCDPTYKYANNAELRRKLAFLFNKSQLSLAMLHQLSEDLHKDGTLYSPEHLEMFLYPAIVRLEVLKWCAEQSEIPFEIYGKGWDLYPELAPFYKGELKSKDEVRKICNQSKYSLLAHPEYFYQQRLLEASACGSIPVIFEGENNTENYDFREHSLIFKRKSDLKPLLTSTPLKSPAAISEQCSYSKLIEKIDTVIKSTHGGYKHA